MVGDVNKSRAYHSGIRRSPFFAMLGCKVEVRINLPLDSLNNFHRESEYDKEVLDECDDINQVEDNKQKYKATHTERRHPT